MLANAPMSHAHPAPESDAPLVVKFLARGQHDPAALRWLRQFPGRTPRWGRCEFVFDPELDEYDWLVVYDDLPSRRGERFSGRCEQLACPPSNTLLVTGEPSSVKIYGAAFLRQFGVVLTSQEPWVIRHPGAVYSQAGLRWYYGITKTSARDYDALAATPPPSKTGLVSVVCSAKQQRHTLHHRRYQFVQQLRGLLPDLEVFGHGVRPIDDKAEALDPFRYHIAIENHLAPHHWTEKLADCFLGWTLPVYYGCPNATDYFPAESILAIDINKPEEAAEIIRAAIANNEYERRLPAIAEARRRVLEEYNLFAMLSRLIEQHHQPNSQPGGRLFSRHALRRARPLSLLGLGFEILRYRLKR